MQRKHENNSRYFVYFHFKVKRFQVQALNKMNGTN